MPVINPPQSVNGSFWSTNYLSENYFGIIQSNLILSTVITVSIPYPLPEGFSFNVTIQGGMANISIHY